MITKAPILHGSLGHRLRESKRMQTSGPKGWSYLAGLGKLERVGIASSSITAWSLVWD